MLTHWVQMIGRTRIVQSSERLYMWDAMQGLRHHTSVCLRMRWSAFKKHYACEQKESPEKCRVETWTGYILFNAYFHGISNRTMYLPRQLGNLC